VSALESKASSGGSRHRGREVALQVLYAVDLATARAGGGLGAAGHSASRGEDEEGSLAERCFDRVAEHFVVPAGAAVFARELVGAVVEHVEELDALLAAHARNWRVSRMAAVDRNVLRLAVYELSHTQTPVAVVIDEAVDLARRFGSESSPAFVNGVLDAVAREVRAA
jgi:N utilization substance protein B